MFDGYAKNSLTWLEELDHPTVIAPQPRMSSAPYRLFVPNNHADVVAAGWHGGDSHASIAEHRVQKVVRAMHTVDGDTIHYVWKAPTVADEHVHVLNELARDVTHLGWGIDMVAGSAKLIDDADVSQLPGEVWQPGHGDTPLRVPVAGTLAGLRAKHAAFLNRLGPAGFNPVPPTSAFAVVGYRNAADPSGRPWAAFELLKPDNDEGGRATFNPLYGTREVAGMVRHAVADVCKHWPFGDVARFVHGHDETGKQAKGAAADRRFQYLPLPTIEARPAGQVIGSIRRVLVAAPSGCEREIDWLRQRLSGQPVVNEGGEIVAILNSLRSDDWVRRQFTRRSAVWSSVTPILLPGFDDGSRAKAEGLIWKAFRDAGLSPETLDGATAEWRNVGFRQGVAPARRYLPPEKAGHWPRFHVRVKFAHPVPGPIAIGAGRYRGFGLFASED